MDQEVRVNARGLSAPGPRMMVDAALEKEQPALMRVVVSNAPAAEDVRRYLEARGAQVEIDGVGTEFHVLARFPRP
ncbi:MAG TPA: sulfurtransferase TusA family protein [Candidatus Krumholzibacteria bacterium]|nr:sulfurtransferase TusA family protein [Candidatus Krumholzibacteria bacterium]